jgi:hypothetical protein
MIQQPVRIIEKTRGYCLHTKIQTIIAVCNFSQVKIFSNNPKPEREKDVEKASDSKLERKLPKKL